MNQLDNQGRLLLAWLVSKLETAIPDDPSTFVSYRDALDALGLADFGPTDGLSLRRQGLDSLANWAAATRKPAITGLIIERGTFEPGEGYYKPYGRSVPDYPWWREQIRLSKEYDWTPYIEEATIPPTPEASDLQPPERIETKVYRVLRDTEVAKQVKFLHKYACQICGNVIQLPNEELYAEAHHIQPLGSDHNGHDVLENLLCVCPNHHVELDYGLWDIDLSALRSAPGHVIGDNYLRYHNEVIRKQWSKRERFP